MRNLVVALACFALTVTTVQARTITVTVDAKSGPWSTKANKKMKYGVGDETAPFILTGLPVDSLGKVEIYADGTTNVKGKGSIGPTGFEDSEVNDTKAKGKYYPSLYSPKVLYPAFRHALMVAFVDRDGMLVSRPIIVGEGIRLAIPDGSAALALGFNDVSFKDNSGSLSVTVTIPDQ